jgi:hypothetical protein
MKLAAILVLIVSFLSILLGVLGYPVIGHDAYVHLNWLDQFSRLWAQGVSYPRWLPDSFGGFGSPTFYFYAPLVYWTASIFHLLGINSPSALYQIVELLFSFLSLFTSYLLIRQFHAAKWPALIGAFVYSFLAYHFCDVYIRDAITEHAALAFLPIVFLRFPNRIRSIAVHGLGWTGLFLTNLPIAYIAVISVLVVLLGQRAYREIPLQSVSFVIAIAISAIYLFPAFALRGLIHQRHLFDLPMHTSEFGFALLDLFQGHFDLLRILSVATVLAGIIVLLFPLLKKGGIRGWSLFGEWKWVLIISIFFQIPFISSPLWHLIPGMPFVQFSWRWNGVLLLAIAILCSRAVPAPSRVGRGTLPLHTCAFIGLAIVTLLCEFTISRNLFTRPPLPINEYRMDAPEYAPKWASNDPHQVIGITLRRMGDPPALLLGLTMPGDSIVLLSRSPIESHFSLHLDRATPVRFHQFYWPYCKLIKDSTEISLAPDPNGFATALLPAGNSIIILKLVESPIEKIGSTVSIFVLSVLFVLCVIAAYRSITTRREIILPPELIRK